jgi:hypothetical protein
LNFLKKYENYSLFLLSNFESYGPNLTQTPYSGNFKLIYFQGEVVAVFCLTLKGNLLIETVLREPIYDSVLEACLQEPIPLKRLVGDWDFCGPFWEYLKAKKLIQKELFTSKEVLYNVDVQKQNFLPQSNARLLTEDDYAHWKPLRLDYFSEQGLANELNDEQMLDLFLYKIKKKIIWGFFQDNILVSIADLNAKTLDLGQVGGVYTVPEFRRKGYSKSVMQQLLSDVRNLHDIRKIIIFTGETNFAAQKMYSALGGVQVGYYALLFGRTPALFQFGIILPT